MSESVSVYVKVGSNVSVFSICVLPCLLVFVNVNVMVAESSIFLGTQVVRRDGSNSFLLFNMTQVLDEARF